MTIARPLYQIIAQRVTNMLWLRKKDDISFESQALHVKNELKQISKDLLPSGGGIDNGSTIAVDECSPDKIKINTAFHHMDAHGGYDGWTNHVVTVKPSLCNNFTLSISGTNRNDIKEYFGEVYSDALEQLVVCDFDKETKIKTWRAVKA